MADAARRGPVVNALTVDVEDYFQVSAMEHAVSREAWDRLPGRVERNTDRVLALFERHGVTATFFTLGWVAERYPGLIARIVAAGHELASHGSAHVRVTLQDRAAFRADIGRAKKVLEDTGGVAVKGYRAASFSIGPETPWAFEELEASGHSYSSTTYPIRHDLYGDPGGARYPYRPLAGSAFVEIPVATARWAGRNWPCGGGGYFRLLPLAYGRRGLAFINQRERTPAVFYFHPWEIDPAQPRVSGLPLKARVRHYTNLARMEPKLADVLGRFAWARLDHVYGL